MNLIRNHQKAKFFYDKTMEMAVKRSINKYGSDYSDDKMGEFMKKYENKKKEKKRKQKENQIKKNSTSKKEVFIKEEDGLF